MGEITIHFDGICTQISQLPPEFGIVAAHRVVLVHAEQSHVVAGKQIPPHVATLDVGDGETPVSRLEGLHLQIGNAVPGRICYDASYLNVPGLRTHNADLAPLKREVVVTGTGAAAHFDVTSGTFASEPIHHGAWRAMLTVQTTDEPILVITPFTGGAKQTRQLRSGSTIIVANTGNKLVPESEFDFYLHYLVTEKVPTHPYYPPPNTGNDLLGPGCSNSNYP